MSDTATIATVSSYDDLIEAFRAARVSRGLSYATVDDLGGLTRGHTEKVLGPTEVKGLSRMMFDTLCGVLAVRLEMVVDPDVEKKLAHRWEKRSESHVRTDAKRLSIKLIDRAKPIIHSQNGKVGGMARNSWAPEKRSKAARKAAKARWRKKRREIKSPPLVPAD